MAAISSHSDTRTNQHDARDQHDSVGSSIDEYVRGHPLRNKIIGKFIHPSSAQFNYINSCGASASYNDTLQPCRYK